MKKRNDLDMNQFLKVMDERHYAMPNSGDNTNMAKFIAKARRLLGEVWRIEGFKFIFIEKNKRRG